MSMVRGGPMTDNKLREKIADLFENELEALNHGQVIDTFVTADAVIALFMKEPAPGWVKDGMNFRKGELIPATNAEVLAGKARKV
jgi:hypothetical protein